MATTRTDVHTDWLDLCEVSEPWIAPPVSRALWPTGLPKTSTEVRNRILQRAETNADHDDYTVRLSWVRWLLTDVLAYQATGTKPDLDLEPGLSHTFQHHNGPVTLTPTYVVHEPGKPDQPRLLVLADPDVALPGDPDRYDPEQRHKGLGWPASPVHRATRLARGVGCRLALITNGRLFTLVGVHPQVVGHGTWDVHEFRREPLHLDSFIALLNSNRVFGPDAKQPEALLDQSVGAQQDVTKTLGKNVRRACELLVAAISRADHRSDGRLLEHVPHAKIYEAAVTTVMRTVFLLTAEENGLLPLDNTTYRDHYAASTLYRKLEDELRTGRATAQRRSYAWNRLIGLHRAVHGGVRHTELSINAYGGSLFDPDRFPFLEGRVVGPHGTDIDDVGSDLVDDLTTYEIIKAITVVDGRPVSFRALDVEQIGHVYESLLDHSTVRADGPILGIVGKAGFEPEVPLADLEQRAVDGTDKLAKYVEERTGKNKKAKWIKERLEADLDPAVERGLLPACGGDRNLYDRVRPFANLLRIDLRGLPMVIRDGDLYVTETTTKRDTGTAYTTRELATEIAKHALDPLIHSPGPQDTSDEGSWKTKSSDDILALKICDPAIGSAAIAVAAVRYLADKLVEARRAEGLISDEDLVASEGDARQLDVYVQARRDVVARCIYGVDVDPMAVEMAKMSLWLITMARDKPFTFLDHAIKCGNSLLGITDLDQLKRVTLSASGETSQLALGGSGDMSWTTESAGAYFDQIDRAIAEAATLRRQLRDADVSDATDARNKRKLHEDAQRLTARLRLAADAITAACLSTAPSPDRERAGRLAQLPPLLANLDDPATRADLAAKVEMWREAQNPSPRHPRRLFHWPLEFAEVFDRGERFDAWVGNPPFLGAQRIGGAVGEDIREHLVAYLADGDRGLADLVAYFFRRGATLASTLGLIATNTIAQGDTRFVGLRALCQPPASIYRADSNTPWPGSQAVTVAKIWWTRTQWSGERRLDGLPVEGIESDLYPTGSARGEPFALPRLVRLASVGQYPNGAGFVLTHEDARRMLDADPKNREVVRPYMIGNDVNSSPTHEPSRWIITFHDWPEERAAQYRLPFEHVIEYVKPVRAKHSRSSYRNRWWRFGEYRDTLMRSLEPLQNAIVMSQTSNRVMPVMVPNDGRVFDQKVTVIPLDSWLHLGVLSSTVHRVWVDRYAATLGSGINYSPTNCFENFPFPPSKHSVTEIVGELASWRSEQMSHRDVGITKIYGDFHDSTCHDPVIAELRQRHQDLDAAVLDAYGWSDVDLGHGFHETRYGTFYTVSDQARYELLARLLDLNFRQYAEQTGRSYESVVTEAQQHV